LISPVRRAGLTAAALGNLGILLGGVLLNALLALAVRDDDSHVSTTELLRDWHLHGHRLSRFPSLAVRLVHFLLPGTSMIACGALTLESASAGLRAASAISGVAIIGIVWLLRKMTQASLAVMSYEPRLLRPGFWTALLPLGEWRPDGSAVAAGPLVVPAAGIAPAVWLHSVKLLTSVITNAVIGVAASVTNSIACGVLLGMLGALLLCNAVALGLVLRPYRAPHEGVLIPLQSIVLAVICFLKASQLDVPSWLKLLQSALMLLQMLLTVALMIVAPAARNDEEATAHTPEKEDSDAAAFYDLSHAHPTVRTNVATATTISVPMLSMITDERSRYRRFSPHAGQRITITEHNIAEETLNVEDDDAML
jgi:hypothetical protein